MPPTTDNTSTPRLNHLVIFNPTLQLKEPKSSDSAPDDRVQDANDDGTSGVENDPRGSGNIDDVQLGDQGAHAELHGDEKDDAREAAQILFYTSRESGRVKKDTMLRQVGLIKGLMGFSDTVSRSDAEDKPPFWSIKSHRARLLVFSPEKDFYIYINVRLAQIPSATGPSEPTRTAQDLSDSLLLAGLQRGYEEFKLLNGPLADALPISTESNTRLERFWTRFTVQFESQYLADPTSDPLSLCLGDFPVPAEDIRLSVEETVQGLAEELGSPNSDLRLIGKDGPLTATDPALATYLHGLLRASIPPEVMPDTKDEKKQTSGLGLGRWSVGRDSTSKEDLRKASWAGGLGGAFNWVPGLGGSRSVTPSREIGRSGTPSGSPSKAQFPSAGSSPIRTATRSGSVDIKPATIGHASSRSVELRQGSIVGPMASSAPTKDGKWSFGGLGGLGEAMGNLNMGSLGSSLSLSPSPAPSTSSEPQAGVSTPITTPLLAVDNQSPTSMMQTPQLNGTPRSNLHVEQSPVALPDLKDAVKDEVDLSWSRRMVWVDGEKRRVSWIIRDNILLYILSAPSEDPPMPSSKPILDLFSTLSSTVVPPRASTDTSKPTSAPPSNPWLYTSGDQTERSGEMDVASSRSLLGLRDWLKLDLTMEEVFAKTPSTRFISAKRSRSSAPVNSLDGSDAPKVTESETYMLVKRPEASLTDAEHAMRLLAKTRPELAI